MSVDRHRLGLLLEEAFQRFGTSMLWNVRQPRRGEPVQPEFVARIARKLAREGGAEALELSKRMLNAVED